MSSNPKETINIEQVLCITFLLGAVMCIGASGALAEHNHIISAMLFSGLGALFAFLAGICLPME